MLRSIRLSNFRSCTDTSLAVDGPISALIGRNGTGKTNILRGIYAVAQMVASGDATTLNQQINHPVAPPSTELVLELGGKKFRYAITSSAPLIDGNYQLSLKERFFVKDGNQAEQSVFDRDGESFQSSIVPTRAISIKRSMPALLALSSLLPPDDPLNIVVRPARHFLENIEYYLLEDRFDRSPPNLVLDSEYQRWKEKYIADRNPTPSVAFRLLYMHFEMPELLAEFKSLVGQDGLGLVRFDGIQTFETEAVATANALTIPTTGPDKPIPSREKVYLFPFVPLEGMSGAGIPMHFNDLSAGTRRVIRMVVSLLFDRRSMMLVEEPEVSIHPNLLRKLINLIRSYADRSQVLFSSHSPDVLNVLRPEDVRLVTAPLGQTIVRSLSPRELDVARDFVSNEGPLSEFFETVE